MYLAHYADGGTIKGFYLQGMHRDIPTPTIEITAEQHADFFRRGQNHRVIDGVWTYVEPAGPTLDELKATKWESIKKTRNTLEQAGVPYMDKILDSDALSVQRITIAVQAAQASLSAGQSLTLDWTTQDNTVLTMTAQEVCGIPVALAMHSDSLHQIASGLRERIESAQSKEEIGAIMWPA